MGVVFVVAMAWSAGQAQTPEGSFVIRMDRALDAIVSQDATVEVLFRDRFGTAEGPFWVKDGQYLLFTDLRGKPGERDHGGRVYKLTPNGTLSILLEPTDGGNGLGLDREGRMILCADKALVRVEKDGKRTTLADRYEGKPFNGPNDLAVTSDGSVYFSDYGSRPELPSGVYRWKNGTVQLLAKNILGGRINGLTVSPDEKFLYAVAAFEKEPRKIVRYNLQLDGTIANERVFMSLPVERIMATRESGRPDGIKADVKGNVYFGGPGGLWIVSPEGKHLGTILIDGGHTNLAFGDADYKSIYLTSTNGLLRVRLSAPAL